MYPKAIRLKIGVVLCLGALAGCADPGEPLGSARVSAGVLQLSGAPAPLSTAEGSNGNVTWTVPPGENTVTPNRVLTAPDTVQAGQAFDVSVMTIGEGGCWSPLRQDVTVSGRVVELRPFDQHSGADVCTHILFYFTHSSSVTLDEPGEWVLRVSGRRIVAGGGAPEIGVSAEKRIVVR